MKNGRNGGIKFTGDKTWIIKELKQTRSKRLIKAYVTMLMNGQIDYKQLGIIWKPTEKIPEASVKRILKQTETQEMIDQELEKALLKNNVTKDFLITKRLDLIDLAKTNNKLDTMLKGIEGFEEMYSMRNPVKETKQLTQSINFKEMLENGSKNELTLSQTQDIEDENNDKSGKDSE